MSNYHRTGLAVEPVFAPSEVQHARKDISELLDRVAGALYLNPEASMPGRQLGERLDAVAGQSRAHADLLRRIVCFDAHRGPSLSALATSEKLRAMAQQLAGTSLTGSISRVRASFASFPEHHHPWHSDVSRVDGTACGRVRIAAWIPLGNVAAGVGGLQILAGMRDAPLAGMSEPCFDIQRHVGPNSQIEMPACPAGSVIFLDRFTPHRTLAVEEEARFALVVWFTTRLTEGIDDRSCTP